MITVYEMKTCPDCIALDKQLSDNVRFRRLDRCFSLNSGF